MQILINTSHDIEGSVKLSAHVEATVKKALHHVEGHVTRVEVHIEEENGGKRGWGDKNCTVEARPRHHQPIIVHHKADSLHQAVNGATRKIKSSLEHLLGRLEDQQHRPKPVDGKN